MIGNGRERLALQIEIPEWGEIISYYCIGVNKQYSLAIRRQQAWKQEAKIGGDCGMTIHREMP